MTFHFLMTPFLPKRGLHVLKKLSHMIMHTVINFHVSKMLSRRRSSSTLLHNFHYLALDLIKSLSISGSVYVVVSFIVLSYRHLTPVLHRLFYKLNYCYLHSILFSFYFPFHFFYFLFQNLLQ